MRNLLVLALIGVASVSITLAAPAGGDEAAAPDGWRLEAAREEIAPDARVVRDEGGGYGLLLKGRGEWSVDGRWVRRVPVKAGAHVAFDARYVATNVETPTRSVVASVLWFDGTGGQVERAEFPGAARQPDPDGSTRVTATYRVPDGATEAQVELRLRWAPQGEVVWRDVRLEPAAAPAPRVVKLASVNHRPRGTTSARENLEQFAKFIAEAGAAKADVVCLPEGVTVCGTPLKYAEVAEPVPGPSTEFLGECAAKAAAYVVAGVYERDGDAIYNTSVLIGRDGKLVGKYRKVCLPREEIDGGITPGTEYPVFDTDVGRLGMMICWDVHYPEVARELSARGAEVILMPIWGGHETLAKARAIENQVYLVCSGYDFRTAIYDKAGEALAKSADDKTSGVIYAEIDLGKRLMWPWLGDWRSRIWLEGPARSDDGPAARAGGAGAGAKKAADAREAADANQVADAEEAEAGFRPIFDGRTLDGWTTFDPSYWSIQDGAITGTITKEHPLTENRYLIWKGADDAPGGQLADFELKLKSRVRSTDGPSVNNGFQFRSRLMENGWDVAGYQVDNNLNVGGVSPWLVRLYDEHGRHHLALRGQRTTFGPDGKPSHEPIPDAAGEAWFKLEEWHEYHLTCVANRLTLKVDGRLVAEVVDNDPQQFDAAGILGLQLHSGPPTVAQFKDVRLKVLTPAPPGKR